MAEIKFEDSLSKLEGIVSDLEGGSLNLDDAIKKYEEGMKLSAFCYKKLDGIQKKIELLVKDPSGNLSLKDFDTKDIDDETKDATQSKKRLQTTKKKRPKGEELLF